MGGEEEGCSGCAVWVGKCVCVCGRGLCGMRCGGEGVKGVWWGCRRGIRGVNFEGFTRK